MTKHTAHILQAFVHFVFLLFLLLAGTQTAQSQSAMLFSDNFIDNRHAWPIINSEIAATDIRSGYYMLQHKRTLKSLSVKKHIPIDESKDYMIVAEIVKYDLQKDPGFGIVWGRKDEDNEYNFLISAKGSFKLLRKYKSRVQTIVDWHPSKYIAKETGKNRLTIKKVGEEMIYYINHHQVAKTKILPFFGDLVGIKVYHAQKIGVKSLKVYVR